MCCHVIITITVSWFFFYKIKIFSLRNESNLYVRLNIQSITYITNIVIWRISNRTELLFPPSFISMIFKIVSHTIWRYNHIVAIDRVIGTKSVNYSHNIFVSILNGPNNMYLDVVCAIEILVLASSSKLMRMHKGSWSTNKYFACQFTHSKLFEEFSFECCHWIITNNGLKILSHTIRLR